MMEWERPLHSMAIQPHTILECFIQQFQTFQVDSLLSLNIHTFAICHTLDLQKMDLN